MESLGCVAMPAGWSALSDGAVFCLGKVENAHTVTGGVGRKADAHTIIPLCHQHHAELHRGVERFEDLYGIDLTEAAAETQRLWLAHSTEDTRDE